MPWGNMGTIWAEFGLDMTKFQKGVQQGKEEIVGFNDSVQREMKKVETNASQAMGTISRNLGQIGQAMSMALTLPLAGVGYAMGRATTQFESAMANVWTLVDVSKDKLNEMGDSVAALSKVMPKSATDLADGLYQVISASVPAEKAMAVLEIAAKGASAGLTTTYTSVDAMTTILNAYGMAAEDATMVSDVMFKTVERGKLNYEQLAGSLGQVISTAAASNVSFNELAGAMAMMTRNGLSADMSANSLATAIKSIVAPQEGAQKAAKSMGIELGEAALESKGLAGVMADLYQATGGSQGALAKLIPEIEGARAVTILGRNAARDYAEDVRAMGEASGATEKAFAKTNQTTAAQLQMFKNSLDDLGRKALAGFIGPANQALEKLKGITEWFSQLPPNVKSTAVEFGAFLAILGPVSAAIGGLIGLFSGPAGWVALATAGTFALAKMVTGMKDAYNESKKLDGQIDKTKDSISKMRDAANGYGTRATELNTLVQEYERLAKAATSSAEAQTKLKEVTQRIGQLAPESVTVWNKLGVAMDVNAEKARTAITNMLKLEREYLDAVKKQTEALIKLNEAKAQGLLTERTNANNAANKATNNFDAANAKYLAAKAAVEAFDAIQMEAIKKLGLTKKVGEDGIIRGLTSTEAQKLQNTIGTLTEAWIKSVKKNGYLYNSKDDKLNNGMDVGRWGVYSLMTEMGNKTVSYQDDKTKAVLKADSAEAAYAEAVAGNKELNLEVARLGEQITQVNSTIAQVNSKGFFDVPKDPNKVTGVEGTTGAGGGGVTGGTTGTTENAPTDDERLWTKLSEVLKDNPAIKQIQEGMGYKDTDIVKYLQMTAHYSDVVNKFAEALGNGSTVEQAAKIVADYIGRGFKDEQQTAEKSKDAIMDEIARGSIKTFADALAYTEGKAKQDAKDYGLNASDSAKLMDIRVNDFVGSELRSRIGSVSSLDTLDEVTKAKNDLAEMERLLQGKVDAEDAASLEIIAIKRDLADRELEINQELIDAGLEGTQARIDMTEELHKDIQRTNDANAKAAQDNLANAKAQKEADRAAINAKIAATKRYNEQAYAFGFRSVKQQFDFLKEGVLAQYLTDEQKLQSVEDFFNDINQMAADSTDEQKAQLLDLLKGWLNQNEALKENARIRKLIADLEGTPEIAYEEKKTAWGNQWASVGSTALGQVWDAGSSMVSGYKTGFGGGAVVAKAVGAGGTGWESVFGVLTGAIGAVAGIFVALAASGKNLAKVFEVLRPIINTLTDAVDALIAPLIPILKILQPVLQWFADQIKNIFIGIADYIVFCYNWFASVVNTLLGWLGVEIPKISENWREENGIDNDANSKGGGSAGTQISEITGPSRDLLVSTLSPLNVLNTLPSYFQGMEKAIYDMRDAFLGVGAVEGAVTRGVASIVNEYHISNVTINNNDKTTFDDIMDSLGKRVNTILKGAGA